MKLSEWMEKKNIGPTYISSRLGVTKAAVCRWKEGKTLPSLPHAVALEELSEGEVRVYDWLPSEDQSIKISDL